MSLRPFSSRGCCNWGADWGPHAHIKLTILYNLLFFIIILISAFLQHSSLRGRPNLERTKRANKASINRSSPRLSSDFTPKSSSSWQVVVEHSDISVPSLFPSYPTSGSLGALCSCKQKKKYFAAAERRKKRKLLFDVAVLCGLERLSHREPRPPCRPFSIQSPPVVVPRAPTLSLANPLPSPLPFPTSTNRRTSQGWNTGLRL